MNPEAVLSVLPDSKDEALSLKEIAHALAEAWNNKGIVLRASEELLRQMQPMPGPRSLGYNG